MTDLSEATERLGWVVENAKADGVRVSSVHLGLGYGGCIWPVEGAPTQSVLVRRRPTRETKLAEVRYETLLSRRLSVTEQLAVLAHELGHLYCGHSALTTRGGGELAPACTPTARRRSPMPSPGSWSAAWRPSSSYAASCGARSRRRS